MLALPALLVLLVLPVPLAQRVLPVLLELLEPPVPLAPRAMAWLSRASMPPCRSYLLPTQPALLAKPSW